MYQFTLDSIKHSTFKEYLSLVGLHVWNIFMRETKNNSYMIWLYNSRISSSFFVLRKYGYLSLENIQIRTRFKSYFDIYYWNAFALKYFNQHIWIIYTTQNKALMNVEKLTWTFLLRIQLKQHKIFQYFRK